MGQGVEYSQREEAAKVGISGRVLSLDRGALAYALQPVWIERQATCDRRLEADQRVKLFGIEIPFLPPAARAGGREGSTTRQLSLLQQVFDEAANRLVTQLETAPPMLLDGGASAVQTTLGADLFIDSRGVDEYTVYLSGRDARSLRRGDGVLLPVVSNRTPTESAVLKGMVSRTGEPCEVSLRASLCDWKFDNSRPIRVLER